MRTTCFLLLSLICNAVVAQNSIGNSQSATGRALQQFNSGEFESVIQLVGVSSELDHQYLAEMSKVNLEIANPDQLERTVKSNPKYYLNSQASFVIGDYYFRNKKYDKSEKALKACDASSLKVEDRKDYYFMLGYVSMGKKAYKSARSYFQRSQQLSVGEDVKLTYYQGFIAYHLDQKEVALSQLNKVKDDAEFGTSAKFFIAKIQLENGQYDEVVSLAQSELSDEKTVTNSEFNQLIGEAYALQNQADKASNYFDKAIELHPDQPSAALYYQAGVANFKMNLKEKAIRFLTEAGIRSGEYAQLSAFQLGRLYVSSGDKEKAVAAYIEASASDDAEIKEESTFKSGKLLLDLKNYSEGINYLEDYREDFENGKWKSESEDLLAEAYLRTSNYDQAINHLLEIGINSSSNRSIYQKVTFRKAFLLFNDGNYVEAIQWFDESVKYPEDQPLKDDAHFNRAEAYFNLSNYGKAIEAYQAQSERSPATLYGLGYSYFNLSKYQECTGYFEQLLRSTTSREIKNDAELRLADAYYATKNYDRSLALYNRISQRQNSSYVTYQIGIVNRNLNKKNEAISSFERVTRMEEDSLTDDAIFQIAQLRFENAEFEKSEFRYGSLISKYPSSNLIPEAYLNRAISRTNLNKMNDSKSDFEYILNNHINSKVAFNAILGLQELQGKGVEVAGIQDYISRYRSANPDDESLEVIEFEFAKSQYFNLKYDEASVSFLKFVETYPESSYLGDAKYYLADAYYRNDELEKAREYFNAIVANRNKFSGRVYSRLGDINYRLAAYDSALTAFNGMLALNLTPKDNYNGRAGLMKTYFAKEDFDQCLLMADEIIAADWKPLNGERNAVLTKSKSFIALQNNELAIENLEKLVNETDRISAEASFLIAQLQFDQSEHEESLESLFDFNSKFGSYQDLIDQSYLLIAGNYIQMDELFQAKATLRSIIQHSTNEEVRAQAQNQLSQIENQNLEDSTTTKQ